MFRRMVQVGRGENDAGELATDVLVLSGIAQMFASRGVVNRASIDQGEGRTGGSVVTNNQRAIRHTAKLATTLSPLQNRRTDDLPVFGVAFTVCGADGHGVISSAVEVAGGEAVAGDRWRSRASSPVVKMGD